MSLRTVAVSLTRTGLGECAFQSCRLSCLALRFLESRWSMVLYLIFFANKIFERISHLEARHLNSNMPDSDAEVVDKSMVVIGGFAADALEDAEKIVQDMLAGVDGFREVDMAGSKQDIALATFDTPQRAMQFIRSQRTNPVMKSQNLWAAENRPRAERMRCKVVSKIKKFMIEIGGVEAKDIKVNYKLFKVSARVAGKNVLVASVNENGELSWLHDSLPGAPVREALEAFMEEME